MGCHGVPWERLAYWASKEVLRRPWLYRLTLRLARLFLRPRAKDGWLGALAGTGAARLTAGRATFRRRRRGPSGRAWKELAAAE